MDPEPKRRGTPQADEGEAYWAPFDGIPLCHVARSDEEAEALRKKGVCGPSC